MRIVDVTDDTGFDIDNMDCGIMPVQKCTCGADFGYGWTRFRLYHDNGEPQQCPVCGRKFFVHVSVRIYEVRE